MTLTLVEELERLARKYARLVVLAEERGAAAIAGGFSPAEGEARRVAFREIAAEFPGVLRELDALSVEALRRRGDAIEAELAAARADASRVAPEAQWVLVVIGLHAELRALISHRMAGGKTGPLLDEVAARLGMSRAELVKIVFGEVGSRRG